MSEKRIVYLQVETSGDGGNGWTWTEYRTLYPSRAWQWLWRLLIQLEWR